MKALVLHARGYKETSALVDFFSLELGIVRAVVRSARSKKGSLIRPFCLLDLEFKGKNELKTAVNLEQQQVFWLKGSNLFCAMYLNELLIRLLPTFDPNQIIFNAYLQVLKKLQTSSDVEPILRSFELMLLKELGYGLLFTHDVNGNCVEQHKYYKYNPDTGLIELLNAKSSFAVKGAYLLAINDHNWHLPHVLKVAKKIIRLTLNVHLGHKPLVSRNLFLANK